MSFLGNGMKMMFQGDFFPTKEIPLKCFFRAYPQNRPDSTDDSHNNPDETSINEPTRTASYDSKRCLPTKRMRRARYAQKNGARQANPDNDIHPRNDGTQDTSPAHAPTSAPTETPAASPHEHKKTKPDENGRPINLPRSPHHTPLRRHEIPPRTPLQYDPSACETPCDPKKHNRWPDEHNGSGSDPDTIMGCNDGEHKRIIVKGS